jgi:hypothetical protein
LFRSRHDNNELAHITSTSRWLRRACLRLPAAGDAMAAPARERVAKMRTLQSAENLRGDGTRRKGAGRGWWLGDRGYPCPACCDARPVPYLCQHPSSLSASEATARQSPLLSLRAHLPFAVDSRARLTPFPG